MQERMGISDEKSGAFTAQGHKNRVILTLSRSKI
jgi:hypothetical protein